MKEKPVQKNGRGVASFHLLPDFIEEAIRPLTLNGHVACCVKGIGPSPINLKVGRRSAPHGLLYIYIFYFI
jgi:hypothetical protein